MNSMKTNAMHWPDEIELVFLPRIDGTGLTYGPLAGGNAGRYTGNRRDVSSGRRSSHTGNSFNALTNNCRAISHWFF